MIYRKLMLLGSFAEVVSLEFRIQNLLYNLIWLQISFIMTSLTTFTLFRGGENFPGKWYVLPPPPRRNILFPKNTNNILFWPARGAKVVVSNDLLTLLNTYVGNFLPYKNLWEL